MTAELTLMALWARHKSACRSIGGIIADARAGRLPGVEPLESGFGHRVTDEASAFSAMKGSREPEIASMAPLDQMRPSARRGRETAHQSCLAAADGNVILAANGCLVAARGP